MSDASDLRDSVAAFARSAIPIAAIRQQRETLPGFDRGRWKAMAELGWLGVLIPEDHGGVGLGMLEACTIAEELGSSLSPEPFCPTAVLAARALLHAGNHAWSERLLPSLASGDTVIALAVDTEMRIGAEPREAAVSARSVDGRVVLDGLCRFVVPGPGAEGFIMGALSAEAFGLYWLPADTPNLTAKHQWHADGTPSTTLHLSGVAIPQEYCIASGEVARTAVARAMEEARVAACAALLGVMRKVFDVTLEYMRTRVQFGRKIGSFQALQHRAVDMFIQKELASCALADAITAIDDHAPADAQARIVSRAKARCNDAAMLIGRESVQLHGAIGFTEDVDVGLYLKRAMVLSQWLGGSAEHRRRYGELSPLKGGIV